MATRVRFPEALLKDVGDLGQVSPHVFGPPGSGSIVRGTDPDPDPAPDPSLLS
jgi:hypothetical protein